MLRVSLFLIAILAGGIAAGRPQGTEQAKEKRLFAAVLLVRGSVSGSNAGSYGLFVRGGSDSTWAKATRSNVISFGLGIFERGATRRYYLAAGNGLHRSEDGGKTWRILTSWRTEEILGVVPDPVDSALLYVATPFGVFRSTDDGSSWERKMNGFRKWFIQRLVMDARDRSRLYAASEDDVYLTTDASRTWQPLHCGAAGQVLALLQSPADPRTLVIGAEDGGIRFSTDGGATWAAAKGLEGASIYTLRASADGRDLYAAGWKTGLWQSADEGRTWTRIWAADSLEAIYSILVDPENPRRLWVGSVGSGIFASEDQGVTWHPAGLPGGQVKQIELYP